MDYLTQQQLNREIEEALARQEADTILGKRKSSHDHITITPSFTFIEGTPEHPIRHIASGKGRLLGNGLVSLANFISGNQSGPGTPMYYWMHSFAVGSSGVPTVPSIRLGIGTTATAYNTTQLASIINTAPNTVSGSVSNPSVGVYKMTSTATWNAGTLGTPTITEAGLYCQTYSSALASFGATFNSSDTDINLVDRICSTDGDFTAFTVNAANPLTLYYPVQISFT